MLFFDFSVVEQSSVHSREMIGSYLATREDLNSDTLFKQFCEDGYCAANANELLVEFQQSAERAFHRAVFVATRCALKFRDALPEDPDAIKAFLTGREGEYLDPERWYRDGDFANLLGRLHYEKAICDELEPRMLKLAREGFTYGLDNACKLFASNRTHIMDAPVLTHN